MPIIIKKNNHKKKFGWSFGIILFFKLAGRIMLGPNDHF